MANQHQSQAGERTQLHIIAVGDFSLCSRGRHSAKHMPSGDWAEKDDAGNLIIDKAGKWMLSTTDGFNRKDTIYIAVNEDSTPSDFSSKRWTFK